MDSKLVVEQMAGRWKVKNEGLRPLALEAAALARRLKVTWRWIPREKNKDADRLANEAMDAAAKGRAWTLSGATATETPGGRASGAGTSGSGAPGGRPSGTGASESRASKSRASKSGASESGVSESREDLLLFDTGDLGNGASDLGDLGDRASDAGDLGAGDLDDPGGDGGGSGTTTRERAARTATSTSPGTGWRPPTSVATSLYLLRHGETPLSVERRFSGLGDPELTPNGIAQAEAAAAKLAGKPYGVQVIVSSPLRRARATAEIVAARAGLEVVVEEGLRETDFGDWEGHTFTEIQRRWPDELAAWLADPSAAPPGGESFGEAARRVQATGDLLVERYEGKTILAVSHVTPIKMLLRFALLAPLGALYRMHLDLSALSLIEYYADGPAVVKAFNDTSHLR
ncbi:bifunctional RNase H/acid phosphatase [Streptosporangium vulgare]